MTEAELELMRRLWDAGPGQHPPAHRTRHTRGAGAPQYATVQKQLETAWRARDWSRRDRSLFVHVFEPAVDGTS